MSGGAGGSDDSQGFAGQFGLTSQNSEGTRHRFKTRQILGEQRTHFAAKIVAVYNRNSITKSCTVDIQPIVKLMDGSGKASSHGTIYGVPVPRNQSGDSVFVNDPQVGDIGHFSVFDRDHSSAQANDWKEANPGSYRRGSASDAVFHGVLPREAQEIKQFFMFTDQGIQAQDRNNNTLNSSSAGWNFNGVKIAQDGTLTAPKNITAGFGTADQVDLQNHAHGTSGPPTPGS